MSSELVFFGCCCCPCEVVDAHAPLSQIAAREDNRLYFDQGWDKDLTDFLIMQHKKRIREGVNPTGGSGRNATECVATGEDQGWGKDLTDSLIIQHKQRIREGVNPTGGSARNATECVATVQKGEDQGGCKD